MRKVHLFVREISADLGGGRRRGEEGEARAGEGFPLASAAKPSAFGKREAASVSFPSGTGLLAADWPLFLMLARSVAREISTDLGGVDGAEKKERCGLEKDCRLLWRRYVNRLYQHRELGLFLDVSRIGFTDEFMEEMEPPNSRPRSRRWRSWRRMQWRTRTRAHGRAPLVEEVGPRPDWILKAQIESTLDTVCNFAADVVSGLWGSLPWFLFSGRLLLFLYFQHLCRAGCRIAPPELLILLAFLAFTLLLRYLLCYGASGSVGMNIPLSNMGWI